MSGATDETATALTVLNMIFDSADKELTGTVKAKFLIDPLSQNLLTTDSVSERDAKIYVKDLSSRLDPRGDNEHVDRKTFIDVGLSWFEDIKKKSNNNASLSVSSLNSGSLLELVEEQHSFNITYGSIEAINGASFSGGKIPYADLAEENSEFRKTIKTLHDEATNLKNNLIIAEDTTANVMSKNQELHAKLKSMRAALDKAMRYKVEVEDLKDVARTSEEECNIYQSIASTKDARISELVEENAELRNSLDEAHDKLNNALQEFEKSKAQHNKTVEKLLEEKVDIEKKLNDTVSMAMQMEQRIEELKSDLSNVRESQFFQKTPPIFDNGECDVFGQSFDDADPFELKRPLSIGPTANSTPFLKRLSKNTNGVRGSIGDEIKMLGVQGSSPLCEKSALLNGTYHAPNTTDSSTQTSSTLDFSDLFTWKNASFGAGIVLVLFVLTFTFFGAIEIEKGRKLMPIFWSPLWPEPISIISISDSAPKVW